MSNRAAIGAFISRNASGVAFRLFVASDVLRAVGADSGRQVRFFPRSGRERFRDPPSLLRLASRFLRPLPARQRGERVRVQVLHEQQEHGRREHPLELAQAGEGNEAVFRFRRRRASVGDVPVVPEPHLSVRPRGDRADVRHLQVQTVLTAVRAPRRGVDVERQSGGEDERRAKRVERIDVLQRTRLVARDAVAHGGRVERGVPAAELIVQNHEQAEEHCVRLIVDVSSASLGETKRAEGGFTETRVCKSIRTK